MLSLADAIIEERIDLINQHLYAHTTDVNEIDEYGFTPLIEAAIADNLAIAKLLIDFGADVNLQDMTGGSALHWAAENNNLALSELLLEKGANPNTYTFSGQPILVMPILRQQQLLKKLLIKFGANLDFAQDFINAKLLGHMFELVGTVDIIDPFNNFVELDYEGFYLEFTLAIIADSLAQFKSHFAGRQIRRYEKQTDLVIQVISHAAQLIKYRQYRVDTEKYRNTIENLLQQEPLILPIGYEGHAITFVKAGNILVKCDRREETRLYDNIVFYRMNHSEIPIAFLKNLIFEKQSSDYINVDLHTILGLQPITELKVTAQISGNCSWANVEACIPALFFLLFSQSETFDSHISSYKNMALNFFQQWREWNKTRALDFCIQSFHQSDSIRKACKAEILGTILFQSCRGDNPLNQDRIEAIMAVLTLPRYEYILQNYIKTYFYEDYSEEGKNFLKLLKTYGYIK